MSVTAKRIGNVRPSAITTLSARAQQLMAEGYDIIDLTAGEPDFSTPDHICAAAISAIHSGETRYTAPEGTPALKQAIQKKFQRENGLSYSLDEIVVSSGGKHVIFNTFLATLDPGDEVVIPAPYWSSYPDIVTLCGGEPVIVRCTATDGFKLTPAALEDSITERTKWVLLNSPSNPTGAVYSSEEFIALAKVLQRHPRIHIFSDEIYEHLVYEGSEFVSFARAVPDLHARTLTMNGVSKTYSMTGWRIGYAGGPKEIIRAIATIQAQSTSNPASISQAAAAAALNGPQDLVAANLPRFRRRRNLVVNALAAIDGMTCTMPEGAFYAYADCSGLLGRRRPDGGILNDDQDVVMYLLDAAQVGLVFGSSFGLSPYIRLSYAAADEQLIAACSRIADACTLLE